jgi:hypothetical protein
MSEWRNIRLPEDVCAEAEKRLAGRFGSLENLLTSLLQELSRDESTTLDRAEEKIIEQRLRDLGYI